MEGLDKARVSFKGITAPEMEKLIIWQESGKLTPEYIRGLPKRYQVAIEGMRWFNKEIKNWAENMGIDTSQWRFEEQNYYPHLFFGDQMLKVQDQTVAIGKLGDLYPRAQQLIDSGTPPADISIEPKFSQADFSATLLSRPGFWSFVNKMADALKVSSDDILNEMQGVAGIKPRKKFVGTFEMRAANLQGYSLDAERVYNIVWDRVMRKAYLEPFTQKASNMISKIKTPWLRKEMTSYIESVGGKYIEPLYIMGINVSKLASYMTRAQSYLKLGFRASTALLNRLQPMQTAYQELGRYYFIGELKRFAPEGRAIVEKLKLSAQQPKFTTGGYAERTMARVKPWNPLWMFTKTEMANREAVGIGAYLRGIREFKMSEAQALTFANDVISATQYQYNVSDLPIVFRNPIGKMAFQFKPFVINYVSNAFDVLTGKPLAGLEAYESLMYPTAASKVLRATQFLGSNLVIGGVNVISRLFTPYGIGLMTYLAINHPNVFQGALSYLGVDISQRAGASPFDLIPSDVYDLLGLPASDIQRIYATITKYLKSEDPVDLLEIMRINPQAWAMYRTFTTAEGVNPTTYERLLIALGLEPSRLSDIKQGMTYIHYNTSEQRTKGNWLPTEQALQNMVYYLRTHPDEERKSGETDRQYATRVDAETKRAEVCRQILTQSGVNPDEYSYYLWKRSQRLG
jgi:hypothetical protein